MRTLLLAIAAVTVLGLLGLSDAAAQREGFVIRSTRSVGMGGTGVALDGLENAVFMNPALLARMDDTQIRLLELQAVINQNTFKQYGFYQDHQDEFQNLDEMSVSDRNRFYNEMLNVARDETVFGFHGMAPLAMVHSGFSFGVYERARVDYDLREGASAIPYIHADAVAEGELVVGKAGDLGRFFGRTVSFGANVKYLYRAVTVETKTAPAVETMDNVRVYRGGAVAFDLGILVRSDRWSFGAGAYDFNYPHIHWKVNEQTAEGFDAPNGLIEGSMRVGLAYEPDIAIPGLFDRFKFALDVQSPMSDDMGFFKKISLGSEVRFARLLQVRAGIHQGYPAAGVGIVLKLVRLEYAFSGEALGRYPGQLDSWNHYISFGLGWGY
jgi:hypothetical protein